jgi:hypothetical protein
MAGQQFGIPPKNIANLDYTGADLAITPVTEAQRDPTVNDKNYPIDCLWRNTVSRTLWYLSGFDSTGALWIKFTTGASGPALMFPVPNGTTPVVADGGGNVTLTSSGGTVTITGGANAINFDVSGGGAPVEHLTGDSGGALNPTANNFNIVGQTVANATHAKPVFVSGAVSTETVQVQVTTTSTSGAKTINNAGLASFDSGSFVVDAATGFISLVGGSGGPIERFTTTGASNDPVIPNSGAVAVLGSNGVTTNSTPDNHTITVSGIQATTAQIGVTTLASSAQAIAGTDTVNAVTSSALAAKLGTQTAHGVLIGEGTTSAIAATAAGTNGQVLLGSTGADPAFATLTSSANSLVYTPGAHSLNIDVINYASGSWTPTLDGATPGATAYSTQNGQYFTMGKLVIVSCILQTTSSTGTGDAQIGGFPFPFASACSAATQFDANWAWPAGTTSITLEGASTTSFVIIKASGSSHAAGNMQMTNAATAIAFSMAYIRS